MVSGIRTRKNDGIFHIARRIIPPNVTCAGVCLVLYGINNIRMFSLDISVLSSSSVIQSTRIITQIQREKNTNYDQMDSIFLLIRLIELIEANQVEIYNQKS